MNGKFYNKVSIKKIKENSLFYFWMRFPIEKSTFDYVILIWSSQTEVEIFHFMVSKLI